VAWGWWYTRTRRRSICSMYKYSDGVESGEKGSEKGFLGQVGRKDAACKSISSGVILKAKIPSTAKPAKLAS